MAEVIPSLITFCMNDAGIASAFGHRIWGNKIPDLPGGGPQPYPYARMREIISPPNYTHQGRAGRTVTIQVDIYDADETAANTNSTLLESLLDGYKGMIGNVDAGMVKAHRGPGNWDQSLRNYWRIVQLEIMTND